MTTIGLAVELPDPWRSQLRDFRIDLGDRSGEGIPPHITLLGPVDITSDLLDEVVEHLTDVAARHEPFDVSLHGTESFRPVSQVVYVRVVEGADRCAALAEDVRRGPLGVDLEFPYHPRVTVAHDLPDQVLDRAERELADFAGEFQVKSFRIYQYDDERGWSPLRDVALSGRVS